MTETERAIIDFADKHPVSSVRGQEAVREAFRPMSIARYFQLLNQLIHRADVIAEYPQTCARLQRLERQAADRRRARSASRRSAA